MRQTFCDKCGNVINSKSVLYGLRLFKMVKSGALLIGGCKESEFCTEKTMRYMDLCEACALEIDGMTPYDIGEEVE